MRIELADGVDRAELWALAQQFLPKRMRRAFRYRIIKGLTLEAAAKRMRVLPDTVRHHVDAAIRRLQSVAASKEQASWFVRTYQGTRRGRIGAITLEEARALQGVVSRQRVEQLRNPERTKARLRVFQAIKAGILDKASSKTCQRCGGQAREYHHHHGYGRGHELDVQPLCISCHKGVDKNEISELISETP